jgi:hypothetical protein
VAAGHTRRLFSSASAYPHSLTSLVSTSRTHAGVVEFQLRSCFAAIKNVHSALTVTRSLRVAECRKFFAGLQSIELTSKRQRHFVLLADDASEQIGAPCALLWAASGPNRFE